MEGQLHFLGKVNYPQSISSCSDCWICYPNGCCSLALIQLVVFHVLKNQDTITPLVKYHNVKLIKKTHKYGLHLPKLGDDALAIDRCTGFTLWVDAIAKVMKNVRVAYDTLEGKASVLCWFQFVKCLMIFDNKMVDFIFKACLVAGSHMTDVPTWITYASATTHETVQIALMLATLNLLDVMVADMMKTQITAHCKEKITANKKVNIHLYTSFLYNACILNLSYTTIP